MPIVALSEKGLNLNAFDNINETIECDNYVTASNIIVWFKNNQIKLYDLKNKKILFETEIKEPKKIKISSNGCYAGVLNYEGYLKVFTEKGIKFEKQNVVGFKISNGLLGYISDGDIVIHKISDEVCEEPIYKSKTALVGYKVFDDFAILATKKLAKDGKHKILKVSKNLVDSLASFDAIQSFSGKIHESGKIVLLTISTNYVKNSYFAESDVYLYNTDENKFKKLSIKNVHSCAILKDSFVVCYGNQPSEVAIFDLQGNQTSKFPKGIRNKIFINQHENIAVFGGFDNLSGDIEVYDMKDKKLLSKLNVLGASLIDWDTTGSYFYVSTTNYFQEDNKITLYDYFGRTIKEIKFESLSSSKSYGEVENFIELEPPAEPIVKKQTRYIPPSLRGGINIKNHLPKTAPVKTEAKSPVRTKEDVLKDLKLVNELKEKMKKGEELSVKDLNFILRESKFNSELKKFDI